jgi:hypothetical protein
MAVTIRWSSETNLRLPDGGDQAVAINESLVLDILTSENYEVTTQVTALVVEEGVPITDHVRPMQDRETLEVMVSESPTLITLVDGTTVEDIELPGGGVASVITVPEDTTRTADAFETLRTLSRDGVRVDVEGLRRPVEGWLIETISAPRESETAGVLVCSMTLVELRVAEFEEVDAPSPRVERRRNRRDNGRRTLQERNNASTDAVSADPENRSEALAALQALGILS